VHHFENFAFLAADFKTHFFADAGKIRGDGIEFLAALRAIGYHHHVEVVLDDGLRDVKDVDVALQEIGGDPCDDSDHVFAYDCYYDFFHCPNIVYDFAEEIK
jgi:hypothetical protein